MLSVDVWACIFGSAGSLLLIVLPVSAVIPSTLLRDLLGVARVHRGTFAHLLVVSVRPRFSVLPLGMRL